MSDLHQKVRVRTEDGEREARVVARTREKHPRYDVKFPDGAVLANVPEGDISIIRIDDCEKHDFTRLVNAPCHPEVFRARVCRHCGLSERMYDYLKLRARRID